ncbi:MAG: CoA transferase [Proteobacteria bacterium]|nr:CoA transferase [Pseudomonadota bacterium]
MAGPLSGYKVVDLTTMISGPLATMMLADQGADVIKVETPTGGDFSRHVATRRGGFSASFLNNNRNKRSIAVDIKTDAGLDIVQRLADEADVFVQNFRPGVASRIGLGYEKLADRNPGIVYLSIAGFGFSGPYAGHRVFDPLVQSLSGLTTVQAGSDIDRPNLVRTILPDKLTGFAAAQAICAALLARSRTGEGQHVFLSMLDTVVSFLWSSDMGGHTFVGDEMATEAAQSFIDLIYETADGYLSVAVMRHTEWVGLSRAVNEPGWLDDPRFQDTAGLELHKNARLEMTQSALKNRTTAEWVERLESEDVPCAPVLTRSDMVRHAQIKANEILMQTDHPQAGRLRQARNAAKFSGTPATHRFGAPRYGGHGRDILQELGYGSDRIDEFVRDRVIVVPEAE